MAPQLKVNLTLLISFNRKSFTRLKSRSHHLEKSPSLQISNRFQIQQRNLANCEFLFLYLTHSCFTFVQILYFVKICLWMVILMPLL
ncbi:hypothetical protein QVD17_31085 [Tagetes erecta]|uniref:Uncharacterized protein n=1 Tax=Tagetes erecta TaxID=13708 RepID=A0AAD8NNU4_TARER|nr:hypothetical protein QVD17_31085 [Tagetes erecta]